MGHVHRTTCRVCKSADLSRFLSLGAMPPVDNFIDPKKNKHENVYPLDVYLCNECKLAQLLDIVPPQELFSEQYAYFSSASLPLVKHFEGYAEEMKRLLLKEGDLVVDIGSNDGVLLQFFREKYRVLGVEPSENVAGVARQKGIESVTDFFTQELAERIVKEKGKAKLVTANNVFAHIDDLDEVVKSVRILLHDDGAYVFEAHYLLDLIENKEFDTVYHEHLCYYSVRPIITLFKRFGMEVFDVHRVSSHGGSIRVFVRKASGKPISPNIDALLKLEEKAGLYSMERFEQFASDVEKIKGNLVSLVKELNEQGKKVIGYGAPAKGNTLLNYCKFTAKDLKYITDTTPFKVGLLTPGSRIPVVSPDILKTETPDHILLLAWNYKEFILAKEAELRKKGTKFIIPIPEVMIV